MSSPCATCMGSAWKGVPFTKELRSTVSDFLRFARADEWHIGDASLRVSGILEVNVCRSSRHNHENNPIYFDMRNNVLPCLSTESA